MYEQTLLAETLSRLAADLPGSYDLEAVLSDLTVSVTAVLGLSGAGVTMVDGSGRLRFVTAVSQASGELERNQEEKQAGPCRDAFDTGEVVRVTDVREESERWPEFSAIATRLDVGGVAGIPMRLAAETVGALNLYAAEPRQWSDEDMAVAGVLADVATSYVVNASNLRQQDQLGEVLRQAGLSRVVIEKAKTITARQHSVTTEQAYQLIQRHAESNNATPRVVAEAIVAVGLQV